MPRHAEKPINETGLASNNCDSELDTTASNKITMRPRSSSCDFNCSSSIEMASSEPNVIDEIMEARKSKSFEDLMNFEEKEEEDLEKLRWKEIEARNRAEAILEEKWIGGFLIGKSGGFVRNRYGN